MTDIPIIALYRILQIQILYSSWLVYKLCVQNESEVQSNRNVSYNNSMPFNFSCDSWPIYSYVFLVNNYTAYCELVK